MKRIIGLCFCIGAALCCGAYQYIVSVDPDLSANPSESAYSAVVSVNAKAAAVKSNESAGLETRYCTAVTGDFAGSDVFRRTKPGIFLIIR